MTIFNSNTREDKYQRIYRKTLEDNICFIAHWELTYRCNLKCRHCYVSNEENRKEVTLQKAKSIIDEIKNMGCLYLILSGGEIFMREDFFNIASYARVRGFALRLLTNGTLLDKEKIERITSLNPLSVEMSLYASGEKLHDSITSIEGSFKKTVESAVLLKEKNMRVVLKFLIMKDNVQEFPAVKSLADKIGVDFLSDFCLVSNDSGSLSSLEHRLNKTEIKNFFLKNNIPAAKRGPSDDDLLCSAGLNNIFITPYLDVYPCIGFKVNLGNLHENNLEYIWNHSEKLYWLRNIKFSDLKGCPECGLVKFCNRCFGIAQAEDGDMLGPSSFDCTAAEAISELAQKRKELVSHG